MSGGSMVTQLVLTTVVIFLFAGSLLGLALGIGLLVRARFMLPFIQLMNQWVSTRQALKPLELPLQVAPAAGGARWFGAVLAALGAFAAVILLGRLDGGALAAFFRLDSASLLAILLEALRWFLVVGSLTAVFTGFMLLFFPQAWRKVEARANYWYSTRHLEIAGDALHPPLDRIVEAFPRASGAVILALSAIAAVSSAMLLFGRA
jgi:hypothetical protein